MEALTLDSFSDSLSQLFYKKLHLILSHIVSFSYKEKTMPLSHTAANCILNLSVTGSYRDHLQ